MFLTSNFSWKTEERGHHAELNCYNISHVETNSIPGKTSGNFGMIHFAEINRSILAE